jgi:hypothetical protein
MFVVAGHWRLVTGNWFLVTGQTPDASSPAIFSILNIEYRTGNFE